MTKRILNLNPLSAFFFCWLAFLSVAVPEAASVSRENAVVRAVRKVSPAVVNVSSEFPSRREISPFEGDPLFERFFRDFFDSGREHRYQRSSLGSGVIIDGRKGLILTNAHVITRAATIKVTLNDEREYEASVVGADSDSDLAVLRIQAEKTLPAVPMGRSDDLMIGEDVIAIGNPFGFSHTVTTGVISALNRSIRANNTVYHDFIQTDASINPGNSGGPLLNINGDLIGVNTAIYAQAQGIGFAIPINKAKRIVADLIQYGEVPQTWIGITVQDITARMAHYLNLPDRNGVLVQSVEPGSPARKADIQDGDILQSLGGIDIRSTEDFNSVVRGFTSGETVRMTLLREGKPVRRSIRAEIFPAEQAAGLGYNLLGIRVQNGPSGQGVMVTEVRPQSYLDQIGVRAGDTIRQIDEITLADVKDFERAMVRYRNQPSVVVLLQRGGQQYYITARMG